MKTAQPVLAFAVLAFAASSFVAQTVPSATPPASADPAGETVTLSVFEVRADKDVGYQAANTASGSRLNTALRDTAASITPLTREFLDDLAVTNLDDLVGLGNFEPEFEDGSGFNAPANRLATNAVNAFRVRGQGGGFSVDLVETGAPVDFSDIERVELSSGPNSILFGAGATGGTITLSTKRATLQRHTHQVRWQAGSWHLQRAELDFNRVLASGRAAIRVWGLWGDRQGWRHYDFEDTQRRNISLTLRPWRQTTVSASHGRGEQRRHVTQPYNAADQFTLWQNLGAQVRDGAAGTVATTGLASLGANDRFTFIQNNGTVVNLRGELTTRGQVDQAANARVLLPSSVSPFDYSVTGPGARFTSDFNSTIVRLEQRIGRSLVVEAAWQRNVADNTSTSYQLTTNMVDLAADPNLNIPLLDGTGAQPNPFAGRLCMETTLFPEVARIENEAARLTAAYDLDLGARWGQHRLASLLENARLDRFQDGGIQVLVDQNGVPYAGAAAPENNTNRIWRRNYPTPGQFATYHFSDLQLPVPPIAIGSRTFTPRRVARSQGSTERVQREIDTWMLATQSFFFDRRLVATFGYRSDAVAFDEYVAARAPAADPRVQSGEKLVNEWVIGQQPAARRDVSVITRTAGAVAHLNRHVSIFYNQSTNFGNPRFERTIFPNRIPPPTEGQGKDRGVMLDLRGDNRYFLRVAHFTSAQIGDAALSPTGTGDQYFSQAVIRIFNYLQGRGVVDAATADRERLLSQFTSFTLDVASRGAEVEFVANPTPRWTLRAAFSYTKRGRENYFSEREPHLSEMIALWRSKDDRGRLPNGNTIEEEITLLRAEIEDTAAEQEGGDNGARPRKFSVTSRYRFAGGRLKGLALGGSFAYADRPTQPTPAGRPNVFSDKQQTGLFATYDFRLPSGHSRWRLQLNVNNVFNTDLVDAGRWNTAGTGLRRVYLSAPRSYRFTTTVNF